MPELYTHLSPRVVVAGAFVVAAAVVSDLARGLISVENKNQPTYTVDTTNGAKFDAVSDDRVKDRVKIDGKKSSAIVTPAGAFNAIIEKVKSDAIAALVDAANAIEKIEVSVAYLLGAVADLNRVTKYTKDDIEEDAEVSLDSLHGDLVEAEFVLFKHMIKNSTPELRRIASDIGQAIDAISDIALAIDKHIDAIAKIKQ